MKSSSSPLSEKRGEQMTEVVEKKIHSHVLVGFNTDSKGDFWRPSETNQVERYENEVPLQDVLEKLFDWQAVRCPVEVILGDGRRLPYSDRHAIVHSKSEHIFKIATESYVIHQYHEWLIDNIAKILDSELRVGIAGVLRGGGGAFVTVETPEHVVSRHGVSVKSKLLAASSHDSKLATSYKMVGTILMCDNMLVANLWRQKAPWNNRHTLHSLPRLELVRESLGIRLAENATAMCDFVDSLAEITVSDEQWQQIVEELVPIPAEQREQAKSRLENKRATLHDMWNKDPRCAPWKGSGFGAFQVFNTHQLHTAGSDLTRIDRNMRNLLSTESQRSDELVIATIKSVTGTTTSN
jgi:phage/plasmid-like protein (TIGR03299 family)